MAVSRDELSTLYTNILGRAPDEAGLGFWEGTGLDRAEIEQQFRNSQEATDNIYREYNKYLYRDPEKEGLDFWRANLGMSFGYGDFAQQLQNSDEYTRFVDPVKSLYSTFLPGQPADDAGLGFWVRQYRASGNEDPVVQSFASLGGVTPESFNTIPDSQYSSYIETLGKFGLDPMSLGIQPGANTGNFQWRPDMGYNDVTWDSLSQADRNRIVATMYGEDSYSPDPNIAQVIRNSLVTGNTRWQGHAPLGDTVENATNPNRFSSWRRNDPSYQNNTSKMNESHPRYAEYAQVVEDIFKNKKPTHEHVYYSTKGARERSPGWVQYQRDVQAGSQQPNDLLQGPRHDFWGKMPGAGIYGDVPLPPINPNTNQALNEGYGAQLDGSQGLQPIGYDTPFGLSPDQYTFTGGPNYTASGGTGFQPIGPAGQPPIFTGLPLDPSAGYGVQPSSGLEGVNNNASLGLDGWSSTLGGNTNASSGIDGAQPVVVNLGWGNPGFSSGYDPGSTYGAYGSAW